MDYEERLAISYYKTIATINDEHKIYLVQHQESKKICVKKILDVYNPIVYRFLLANPITGIPRIYNVCEEDGVLTIIEEYISGISLQEIIEANQVSTEKIVRYMGELCDILRYLHSLQPPIVHRDIKPSNIIVTPYDHIVLLDFNAAKYATKDDKEDTVLLGTKGYAAPEQYGFGSSTPQTDIYALGILLKQLVGSLSVPTDKFDAIIDKCTQMKPSDRITDVYALKDEIMATDPKYKQVEPIGRISLIPPGYRTRTPWKMLIATIIYAFIFWLCISMEVENATPAQLWVERIFCLIIMLMIVFCSFNYLDMQRMMPLCSRQSRIVRFVGIVLMDIIAVVSLFVLMALVATII
jgi:hypothetical protein